MEKIHEERLVALESKLAHQDYLLDVLNLTDRKNNDVSYFYRSRLPGEPAEGVEGVHLHPAQPRTFRLTARLRF